MMNLQNIHSDLFLKKKMSPDNIDNINSDDKNLLNDLDSLANSKEEETPIILNTPLETTKLFLNETNQASLENLMKNFSTLGDDVKKEVLKKKNEIANNLAENVIKAMEKVSFPINHDSMKDFINKINSGPLKDMLDKKIIDPSDLEKILDKKVYFFLFFFSF